MKNYGGTGQDMSSLIVLIFIIWIIARARGQRKGEERKPEGRTSRNKPRKPLMRKKEASAVPNKPKRKAPTKEETQAQVRMSADASRCDYQASYSKGKPDRIGRRGDYEDVVPNGMVRVRCRYCGADNFVPSGTREHYHCYFCWEKL